MQWVCNKSSELMGLLFNSHWHVSETQPRGPKQSRQGVSWRAIIPQQMNFGLFTNGLETFGPPHSPALFLSRPHQAGMPKKQKINLAKVLDSLNTACPKCGYSIPPNERTHVDTEHIRCPMCGERFKPGNRVGK
jgi:ribosomal protein S27AE